MVHPSHRDEIGAERVARPARIRADSAVAEEALPDSEALFWTLAETSSTLISLFEGDQVTYVNPAMQAALGITEADVPTLRIKGSLIASTERQEARATIDALQRGEITDPVRFERASVRGDGRQRWLEMTFAMVDLRGRLLQSAGNLASETQNKERDLDEGNVSFYSVERSPRLPVAIGPFCGPSRNQFVSERTCRPQNVASEGDGCSARLAVESIHV